MKIAFTTLGCKLNYAETSTYERGFLAAGWEVVPWNAKADVYLVNSCSVTEMAEKKSRSYIRRAHKTAPDARIVVTGCYAQLRGEKLLAIDGVWKVFGADEKRDLVPSVLEGVMPENFAHPRAHKREGPAGVRVIGTDDSGRGRKATFLGATPSKTDNTNVFGAYSSGEERTRSFLKVQDGCDNFCAYCTVPYARGRSRSIQLCEVKKMALDIAAKGVKEIVLTGVNTGDYGRGTDESFLDLLKMLNGIDGIERYRISSIEPNLITEEIVDWIGCGTKFLRHFHIPLQSGSDLLLKKVGRCYDTALFASRIDYIRKVLEKPGQSKVFFGIDVIAGLPGETEELFMETYNFLKERIRPAFIHVFPYSRRPGTRAASWPDQVQDSVKTERVARLEALCEDLHAAFVTENKGLPEQVLWEGACKNGMMGGYTGNYIRVERPFDAKRANTVEDIVI
ncbi:MAG: tRNA (N(6)-L-threonylcarbamoyladenosine(37)-C(2))-methylthiotransferase MtaB [Bacteroidales bacterium]|nr:tRNA (N(6)-L-threonylcarbamoyladenosine(37)-C(2))-methylthiotransferase MtaB [Bacteroidales bacterium]